MEQRAVTRVWCERRGNTLLLHRSAAGARRFANIHELPTAEQAHLDACHGGPSAPLLAKKRRGITRFQITESIHAVTAPRARANLPAELVWVPLAELGAITLSGPHRRWIGELLAGRS